jgi:DNA-binding MarR family transcriptional regulator
MSATRQAAASALHSACIHVLRFVRTVDSESGLTAARLSALSVLVFGGPCTIGELARAEGVRSPTITALVNGLEAEGLVRRVAGAKGRPDQRHVVVEATAAGTRRMKAAQARRLERLDLLLDGMPATDVATLARAADLLEGALRLRRGDG